MIITTAAFPFVSSFHRPRLRPCPRRAVLLFVRSAASSSSSWEEREEARWLREEQRWLREEQRWLREESRWRSEREALLSEITALHLRLRALEPLADATAPVPPLAPKPKPTAPVAPLPPPAPAARVAPPPPKPAARVSPPPPKPAARVPPPPPPVPAPAKVAEVRKEVIVEEKAKPMPGSSSGKRRALRVGSEGEEVRLMQEALEKLGFYSGEEDTEFSSFSTGTERAVKTWQASIGTTEDGLMTSELLERLFTGDIGEDMKKKDPEHRENYNMVLLDPGVVDEEQHVPQARRRYSSSLQALDWEESLRERVVVGTQLRRASILLHQRRRPVQQHHQHPDLQHPAPPSHGHRRGKRALHSSGEPRPRRERQIRRRTPPEHQQQRR